MEQQNKEYIDDISLYDFGKVIAKRKILILGLFIIIVGLTTIISFLMPDIYRGETGLLVVLNAEEIKGKEITDLIGNVDREKRSIILPKLYSHVRDLKFKALKDSKNKIIVTIDAGKMDDIPKALLEVMQYLNNMDIVKSETKREKDVLVKKSAELSEIIKSSQDLLSTYHSLFSAGKISTIGFNPIDFNKKIIDIKIELLTVEQQLSRLNNGGLEIAAQPYIPNHPVSPKILLNVIWAGIFSLLFGVFLAFFMEYKEKIKKIGNINSRS
jgi:capsular polysaccharide biosynthesis protein